jgi:hypothetical protein
MGTDGQRDGWSRFDGESTPRPADKTPSVDRAIKQSAGGIDVRDNASGPADNFSKFENRRTSGFDRIGGKWSKADGLVSRKGYRRILPESRPDSWALDYQLDELEDVSRTVLRERKATVFENLVLDPLRGKPGKTIDDLAKQFGVSVDAIYRIKNKCKVRIEREVEARRAAFAKKNAELDETCELCGRTYGDRAWPRIRATCKGHRAGKATTPTPTGLNWKCLYSVRIRRWEKKLAEITPEKRAQMQAEYLSMVAQREAEYEARRLRDNTRISAELREIDTMTGFNERATAHRRLCEATDGDNQDEFEAALAEFRIVVARQHPKVLWAFDVVSNAAREAGTYKVRWAAVEELLRLSGGIIRPAALYRTFSGSAK